MSRRILLLSTAAFAALSSLSGAEPDAAPPRHARFLAVGETPPFRQEIRDGVRYELDPPEGSIPPREVFLGADASAAVPLRLGRISEAFKVPPGAGALEIKGAGAKPDDASWQKLQRPETGDFLVVFCRKPSAATWREAAHIILPDGPLGAPAGTVRVANLFPQSVRVVWAGESIVLNPGANLVRPIAPGSETPFQVLVADAKGTPKRYFSTSVTQNPGERGWIILYRADGEAPRRPLKVSILREPVIAAKPPVREEGKPD